MVAEQNILFIDTTNSWIVIGLHAAGKYYGSASFAPREAFRQIPELIQRALKEAGIEKPDCIGCVRGPGSFTGTRLGVATVRNLAQLWQIPIYHCDSLSYYAREALNDWQARQTSSSKYKFPEAGLAIMLDGKQQQAYACYYPNAESLNRFEKKIQDIAVDQFLKSLPVDAAVYVDNRNSLNNYLPDDKKALSQEWLDLPVPGLVGLHQHLQNFMSEAAPLDWADLLPLYLRADPAHASHPHGFRHS